jgi:hypothetical protein
MLGDQEARELGLNEADKARIAARTSALARHFVSSPASAAFVEDQVWSAMTQREEEDAERAPAKQTRVSRTDLRIMKLDTVYRSLDIAAEPRQMMHGPATAGAWAGEYNNQSETEMMNNAWQQTQLPPGWMEEYGQFRPQQHLRGPELERYEAAWGQAVQVGGASDGHCNVEQRSLLHMIAATSRTKRGCVISERHSLKSKRTCKRPGTRQRAPMTLLALGHRSTPKRRRVFARRKRHGSHSSCLVAQRPLQLQRHRHRPQQHLGSHSITR